MPASPVDDEEPRTDARSITDRVADQLRERIKYGRLAPGQRLVEADLIGQLRVSRSTIRAAFGQLATEGIVTLERNRGARVRLLDVEEIRQLYELRATLEGRAAGLTAERIDIDGCRTAMRELSRQNDEFADGSIFADYWSFNEGLHRVVLQYSGNEMLRRMAEQTRTLTYHHHLQAAAQGDPRRLVSIGHACVQHDAILGAILVGDATRAEQGMREHILDNGRGIVAFMEAEGAALSLGRVSSFGSGR